MTDSTTPNSSSLCDARAEDISLLAAGCLPTREADDLRSHIAACNGCRESFEQLQSVCSELRAAKPAVDEFVGPFVAQAARLSLTTDQQEESGQRQAGEPPALRDAPPTTRRRRVLLAAVVAGVLVLVSALFNVARRPEVDVPPRSHDVVREEPTQSESQRDDIEVPEETERGSEQQPLRPTLLALSQAAAVSDEALDRLLAQTSVSMLSEPVSAQSFWQQQ